MSEYAERQTSARTLAERARKQKESNRAESTEKRLFLLIGLARRGLERRNNNGKVIPRNARNGEERKKEVKRNAKAWAVFGEAGCADMREGARVPLFAPRGEPRQGRTTARQNTPQNTAGRRAIKKNVARNARRIKSRRARERQRFSSAESAAKNGKKISRRRIASASGEAIRASAQAAKERAGQRKEKAPGKAE